MTILKRIKVPVYYLKTRKDSHEVVLEKIDESVYVKTDNFIKSNVEQKKPASSSSRDNRKLRKSGEYSVRLNFLNPVQNKSEKYEIKTELSDALISKKAQKYFKDLIVSAMNNANDNDQDLKVNLNMLEKKKQLYHFYHRSTAKNSILYSIIPNSKIPKKYANKEMIENFIYNVANIEIAHITKIKNVNAEFK